MASAGVAGFEDSGINAFLCTLKIGNSLHLGTMAGVHVTPRVSLNAELTVEIFNIDPANGSGVTSGRRGVLAFSPLLHLPIGGRVEVVAGLKLGLWRSWRHLGGTDGDWIVTGSLLGINAGAYYPLGPILVGVFATYESASIDGLCLHYGSGTPDDCNNDYRGSSTENVGSVAGSVLF